MSNCVCTAAGVDSDTSRQRSWSDWYLDVFFSRNMVCPT